MLATVRGTAIRLRGALHRHTVAAWISIALAAAVAGLGAGFAIANPVTPATVATAATTGVAGGTPGATPAATTHADPLIRALVGLTAKGTGTSVAQVAGLLRQNETLNQIAGSDAANVVQAAESAVSAKLEARVATGKLTPSQETPLYTKAQARLTQLMSAPGHRLLRALRRTGGHSSTTSPTPSPSPATSPAATAPA